MKKNEAVMLPIWVKCHGEMFGYSNLFVYDNGSDLTEVQGYLAYIRTELGVHADY